MAIQVLNPSVRGGRVVTNTKPVGTTSSVLTILRLPTALALLSMICSDHRTVSLALLVAFVVLDLADGAAARRQGGENRLRRAADSIIDRSTVSLAMICAGIQHPTLMAAGIVCATASLLAAPLAVRTYTTRHATLSAPKWHRVWSLSYAVAGAAWATGHAGTASTAASFAVILMCCCTALMARDHRCLQDLGP